MAQPFLDLSQFPNLSFKQWLVFGIITGPVFAATFWLTTTVTASIFPPATSCAAPTVTEQPGVVYGMNGARPSSRSVEPEVPSAWLQREGAKGPGSKDITVSPFPDLSQVERIFFPEKFGLVPGSERRR